MNSIMSLWPSRLGRPGLVALLALAAAVPLATWVTPQLQLQQRPPVAPATLQRAATPPPAAITLPAVGEPADRVADLLALALRHGVSVVRTQQQRQQQGPVQRLQLGLSAQGRYTELRSFIAAALQADPGLALDTLQLRRATPDQAVFDAELQWSLLRAEAGFTGAAAAIRGPWPDPGQRALLAWTAPAPPAAPPVAATKPPTPVFPYRWIGRLDDGSTAQVLLAGSQRSFGVRAGDVFDGRWRLDAIAAAQLQLTWLPTGEAVTVDTR